MAAMLRIVTLLDLWKVNNGFKATTSFKMHCLMALGIARLVSFDCILKQHKMNMRDVKHFGVLVF
jgi:hypothetical protein